MDLEKTADGNGKSGDGSVNMPTAPRNRWIARRAVMAVAVPVLLLGWYVMTYVSLTIADSAGLVPDSVPILMLDLFSCPVGWYLGSDLPGTESFQELLWAAADFGWSLRR